MSAERFKIELTRWLSRVVNEERPSASVVAFNVGLFETADGYRVYLMGADSFEEGSGDWACEETFTPRERYLEVPAGAFVDWKDVQRATAGVMRGFLESDEGRTSFLSGAKAVTVGFDDGDLERVR